MVACVSLKTLLVISGPTASGKSALGLTLARSLGGEIVNVDSVQIYKGAEIGSAMPSAAEQKGIRHHLIDFVLPSENYNVARFIDDASREIYDIRGRGVLPILLGGSTLYITTLLHGLAQIPQGQPSLRQELEQLSDQELFNRLQKFDQPSANKLHQSDRLRVIRAIEVFESSGVPLSKAIDVHKVKEPQRLALILVLCWRRDVLYSRIEKRAVRMLERGLVMEVSKLQELYGPLAPLFRSVGYAEVQAYLNHNLLGDALSEKIAMSTRRLAKRQMTFWRNAPLKHAWSIRPQAHEPDIHDLPIVTESRRRKSHQKSFSVYSVAIEELLKMVSERLTQNFEKTEVWYLDGEKLGLS